MKSQITRRRLGVLAAAMVVLAAPLAGCSESKDKEETQAKPEAKGPQTTTIEISYDDLLKDKQISRSVNLAVGDFLQLSLGNSPSTGFQWSEELLISDKAVLAQTAHESVAPGEDRPGASGKDVWVVQAMAAGNATASATYGQPWPGGEKEAWVVSVNVTVD